MIFAIDFDGTVARERQDGVTELIPEAVTALVALKRAGHWSAGADQ